MATARALSAGQTLPIYARTAGRAVHVKIHPRPRNIAESREVLRVLQQYGEVIMYKHLKHEPQLHAENTALAIYQSTKSAQNVINASPVRFELGRGGFSFPESEPHGSSGATSTTEEQEESDGVTQDQSLRGDYDDSQDEFKEVDHAYQRPKEDVGGYTALTGGSKWPITRSALAAQKTAKPLPARSPKTFTPNPTPSIATSTELPIPPPNPQQTYSPSQPHREFYLTITRSSLNHQDYIQRQHYYSGFKLDMNTIMGQDLEGRIPVEGMADCQLGRGVTPLRMRMKRREGDARRVMSLGEMWREGREER
ncbi:hypothetical protein MMC28_004482 [Mycoblastus sanguinarius]|nr:hypothetical protein [Mycoblastus sanguinarius]